MMECNKDEAIRAKEIAEKKMQNNDFEGARRVAMKAQQLFPELENINQLLTVCNVHCAAQNKILGSEKDLYGILQLDKFADEVAIKKQYRKLALTLHPDKNQFPGAEAAFKLISEANVVLLDPGKKAVFDSKCKVSIRSSQAQPSQYQFSSFNARQKMSTPSVIQGTFWTTCHNCGTSVQYLKKYVNHIVPCQRCTKPFAAYELNVQGFPNTSNMVKPQPKPMPSGKVGTKNCSASNPRTQGVAASHPRPQGVPSTVNRASGNQTPVSPPEDSPHVGSPNMGEPDAAATHTQTGLQGNASKKTVGSGFGVARSAADGEKVKSGNKEGSNLNSVAGGKHEGMYANKKEKLSGRKRGRKHVVESSESCDTSSSNGPVEDAMEEDNAKSEGNGYSNETITVSEAEFTDFDKDKQAHCFAVDQMWAIYDTLDGMPRFYALITKVFKHGFNLRIRWLEGDPEDDGEISWLAEELPFACGRFRWGQSTSYTDRLSFSHQVHYEKGQRRKTRVYIRPRKGEIWALIKDWDINWNSDPDNHKKFKFEIVEVVSDFSEDAGISVLYLDKVKGFVCLFKRASLAETDFLLISPDQMLRFSHRIPHSKMTGTESEGVPVGSFELDPASLPSDPDDICYPQKVISNDENLQNGIDRLVKKSENVVSPGKNARGKGKDVTDFNAISMRRSPRGVKTDDRK